MKITLTQTEEGENYWDTIEEVNEYEMTWELQSARPETRTISASLDHGSSNE